MEKGSSKLSWGEEVVTVGGDIVGRRMRNKLRDVKGSIVAKKVASIEGHNHQKQSSHNNLPRFGIEGRTHCETPHCCRPFFFFLFFLFFTLSVGFLCDVSENGQRWINARERSRAYEPFFRVQVSDQVIFLALCYFSFFFSPFLFECVRWDC